MPAVPRPDAEEDPDELIEAERVARRRAESEAERRALFEALLADDPFVDEEPEPPAGPEPWVVAVLVAHDGAHWLHAALDAVAAQTRPADRLVVVDTGSVDGTAALLATRADVSDVVRLPRTSGYGAAVAAGLAASGTPDGDDADRPGWIWLLHDDAAPDPDALAVLLGHARRNPSVAVLGAKAVDWDRPDRLVDVGLTTDRAGRRVLDLEPFELDQGQHDQPRDVLAVGTAAALVRRDVWEALGGFDPRLPLLREDIDLGWRARLAGHRVVVVPRARVRHARATLTGRRGRDLLPARVHRRDRRHGLYVVLANSGLLGGGMVGLPRVLVAGLLRVVALLLTRRPREAGDELRALGWLATHPAALAAARFRRRRIRRDGWSVARPYLVRPGSRLRAGLLATTDMLGRHGALAASGPPGEDEDLPGDDATLIRRIFFRPVVGLVLALTAIGLAAERSLLHGGALRGGRLLQVPPGSSDLWHAYAASWHPGTTGSATPASPWEPVLAAVSFVFGGSPPLTVTLLFLLAVPLAGWSAWMATRRTQLSTRLRLWAAATYALLPVLTGAVAGGRFDAVVAVIAVPLLVSGSHRILTGDPHPGGWYHAFALGIGLAVTASFSPPIWTVAVVALLPAACALAVVAPAGSRAAALRRVVAVVVALGTAPLLLFPYVPALAADPRELLVGLGVRGGIAGQTGGAVDGWDLLFLHPGGPLLPPVWLTAPLLVAAGIGLVRTQWSRAAALAAWTAVVGYGFALAAARVGAVPGGDGPDGWPGPALAVTGAAVLLAALVAARRGRAAMSRISLGPRQPLGVAVAALALAVPVALGVAVLVKGTDGPLVRASRADLPSFVADDAARDVGQRILRIDPSGDGRLGFRIGPVAGSRMGDEDLRADGPAGALLARVVADLASNRGTDAAEVLATYHVDYVAVPRAAVAPGTPDADLPAVLDAQPALSRFAVPGPTLLWRLLVPSARAEVLTGALARAALDPAPPDAALGRGPLLDQVRAAPPQSLAAAAEGVRATIADGPDGRVVVLADARDAGWRATVDGRPLEARTAWNWSQAFVLPAGGGTLHIWHANRTRTTALLVQAIAFGVILVLAAPTVGRRGDDLGFGADLEDPIGDPVRGEPDPGSGPDPAAAPAAEPAPDAEAVR